MFRTVALVLLGTSVGFGFSMVSDGDGFAIKVPEIEAGKLECRWLPENTENESFNREFLEPRY
ncbi:MAG: hypothetical protein F6K40_26625 [Okeania sp. SIO3I5]|uniref:hypothetical protein n=1 Tax=Okeania sp. SIO3I5 TaxID=2607805 RepID=UPI0013B5B4B0|nr:hypothetical protein [Okeania sp. SIO3I5]NEQ39636.1 hypothetical protein [Okeania sp. SIO3I5]